MRRPDCRLGIDAGGTNTDAGIGFDGRGMPPLDTDAIARFLGEAGD